MLDSDIKAVIEAAHLCFAATVSPDGRPSLSPKGTIRVLDDHRVFFLDIASPGTRANLEANPWMEINVVDQLSRRGYRLSGRASIHRAGAMFDAATARIDAEDGVTYRAVAVIVLAVESARPIVSPGYRFTPDEQTMRASWALKRAKLDATFEQHTRAFPFDPRMGARRHPPR